MTERLTALRQEMQTHKVDAFLQPVHDAYMSEYPPESNQRVAYISGFSGSAGTAVILAYGAALFTDGRYTLQAAQQVSDKDYELLDSGAKPPEVWLAEKLSPGQTLGYDATLFSSAMLKKLETSLSKKQVKLKAVPNLVDSIWQDRPTAPVSPLFIHPVEFSGEESAAKRVRIAAKIREENADAAVLTAPESVCWLLNIRAHDVENTPVALVYAIITSDGAVRLYVAPERVSDAVRKHLGKGVEVVSPETLEADLKKLKGRVLLDPASASVWFAHTLKDAGAMVVEATDPCVLPKACKNALELTGIRAAHIRDGAAVAKLLCWLDSQDGISEIEVADKLLALRAESNMFTEPSFPTIAGSGPNGAIVHYRANEASNRILKQGELFLLDSGGQYPDGTTDITRTMPVGTPTAEHIDRFTRVLKGHIAIATARFPEGTAGSQLDSLARQSLWEVGLDYEHGTGHGVGQFLGVHEGPQRISKRGGDVKLMPGMVVSNEPGYYKTGSFGIRIENLVTVVELEKGESGKSFLGFDTLTCVPIDTRLVDSTMLSETEKTWLNSYHAWVLEQLSSQMTDKERAWLAARCEPIG